MAYTFAWDHAPWQRLRSMNDAIVQILTRERPAVADHEQPPAITSISVSRRFSLANSFVSLAERRNRQAVSPPFAPEKVNVADQRRDPESLLNWMERAIRARKELPELGWGTWKVLDTDQPSVLAHRCDWLGQGVLVLHNLGLEAVRVAVQLDDAKPGRLLAEVLANRRDDPVEAGRPLALDGYGYRWLRLPPAEPG